MGYFTARIRLSSFSQGNSLYCLGQGDNVLTTIVFIGYTSDYLPLLSARFFPFLTLFLPFSPTNIFYFSHEHVSF